MAEPVVPLHRSDSSARRRIDPAGKQALFSTPVQEPATSGSGSRAGDRSALFSEQRRAPGTVLVDCASCGRRKRVGVVEIGLRLAWFSVFVPFRRYPHRILCPACGRRSWCRIAWTD